MKRTGRILTAATVLLGVVFTAPIIVKAVKGKQEDESKKEPVRQAVVLLDAAKTPEQLGVTSVQLNIDGSNCTVRLKDGRVKFAAGCGADKLIANVQGFGQRSAGIRSADGIHGNGKIRIVPIEAVRSHAVPNIRKHGKM